MGMMSFFLAYKDAQKRVRCKMKAPNCKVAVKEEEAKIP